MSIKDEYLAMFRQRRAERLATIDRDAWQTIMDGGDLADLQAERRALLDFPAAVTSEERATLIAQWPGGKLGDLPEWFTTPETVEALGPALVTDCKEPADTEASETPETVEPSVEAQILAKRLEKARAEDALRATGKVVVALNTDREASAEDLGL